MFDDLIEFGAEVNVKAGYDISTGKSWSSVTLIKRQ